MKIVQLSSENILRLNAVKITPDGNLIVVGGKNAQGKTSVLDSIWLAMGGKKAKHTEPLKKGTKKGKIVVKVSNGPEGQGRSPRSITVTRTYTPKGSTLTVTYGKQEL
ncbi:MAG: AAA family ATPase, partial [Deltaproteobacteria bacterium]|nr:AAA family ATPase [Deltaproteobacteria bacterium]